MKAERLLTEAYLSDHPADAARSLEGLSAAAAAALLVDVDPAVAAKIVGLMTPDTAVACLADMDDAQLTALAPRIDAFCMAAMLRTLPAAARDRLLAAVGAELATSLRVLSSHPEGTAGAMMDPRPLVLPPDIDVAEATRRLRKGQGLLLNYVYVVARDGTLAGVVRTRDLMLADPARPLIGVATRQVEYVRARESRAAILGNSRWRDHHALPVCDDAGRFLGVLRYATFHELARARESAPARTRDRALWSDLAALYWSVLRIGVEALTALWSGSARRPSSGGRRG